MSFYKEMKPLLVVVDSWQQEVVDEAKRVDLSNPLAINFEQLYQNLLQFSLCEGCMPSQQEAQCFEAIKGIKAIYGRQCKQE